MDLIGVVEQLFHEYGYLVLLIGLPLDFMALPVPPGNSPLTHTGFLASKDVLHGLSAIAMALTGGHHHVCDWLQGRYACDRALRPLALPQAGVGRENAPLL